MRPLVPACLAEWTLALSRIPQALQRANTRLSCQFAQPSSAPASLTKRQHRHVLFTKIQLKSHINPKGPYFIIKLLIDNFFYSFIHNFSFWLEFTIRYDKTALQKVGKWLFVTFTTKNQTERLSVLPQFLKFLFKTEGFHKTSDSTNPFPYTTNHFFVLKFHNRSSLTTYAQKKKWHKFCFKDLWRDKTKRNNRREKSDYRRNRDLQHEMFSYTIQLSAYFPQKPLL